MSPPMIVTPQNGDGASGMPQPGEPGPYDTARISYVAEDAGHNWKHKSSHPLENFLTPLDSGIFTESKLRNMCAYSAYVSLVKPKNMKEALQVEEWISAMQ